MRFNTNNPVEPNGSSDPRDLYDNTAVLDLLLNGPIGEYLSRLGVPLKSWQGILQQVTDYLIAQGYESVYLNYSAGVVVQRQTQLIPRSGELYRVMNALDIPLTLTGTWAADSSKLQAVGDAVLRKALADPALGAGIVAFDESEGYPAGSIGDEMKKSRGYKVPVSNFGIFPDGITNWESVGGPAWDAMWATAQTSEVVWGPGVYATTLTWSPERSRTKFRFEDGAILGGVLHLISSESPNRIFISSAARASNIVTVTTAAPHGRATGDRVQVADTFVTGTGAVPFNGEDFTITVTSPTTFTYAQNGPDATATVLSISKIAECPVTDVSITGFVRTADRIGTINCKRCYIEKVAVINRPDIHAGAIGQPCRGAHIYVGTEDLRIGELTIEYASGANTDAAFSADGQGWNPKNLKIGRLHVIDSAYSGVYLTGEGHTFGEIRVDAYAKEVPPGISVLPDSNGSAQTAELKGFWSNRTWNTHIGVLRTSQNLQCGTRFYEKYHALIDQTGHPSWLTDRAMGLSIDAWYVSNIRKPIAFGDVAAYNSVNCNVKVGLLEISMIDSAIASGEYAVRFQGAGTQSDIEVETLSFLDSALTFNAYVETTANASIGRIISKNHRSRILNVRGKCKIGSIVGIRTASGSQSEPIVHIQNSASAGTEIGSIDLTSTSAVLDRALQCDSSSTDWTIGKLKTLNYRISTGVVYIDTPISAWRINSLMLDGGGAVGVGMAFNGAVNDGYIGPGRITGFSNGLVKGTTTFARNTAVGVNVAGNTIQTDLPLASFHNLGCTNITLTS